MKFQFSLLSIFLFSFINAQLSKEYQQENAIFKNAENHYFQEAYRGSQYDFNQLMLFKSDLDAHTKQLSQLYSATVALLYDEKFALEELEHYESQYPESNLNEQTYYALGTYYARNQNHKEAIKYLKSVNYDAFPEDKKNAFLFTLGYSYFQEEKYAQAKSNLSKISDDETYFEAKEYMIGHIDYTDKKYDSALQHFENIKDNPKYQTLIQPYLVQIYFNNKEYDKAIQQGENLLATNQYPDLKPELSKIIGESHFKLKNYSIAAPYLETYANSIENPTFSDYYQLGYVFYEQKNYEKSVDYFNKITNENSAIAQNAFFQLGNAYVKNNQKEEALSAYKSAAEMNYDAKVKENAHYHYAKLSYDVGNPYKAAPIVIQEFISTYPNSAQQEEMKELLVHSFLLSKNYKGAADALKKLSIKNENLKKTEQTVNLFYGLELFNKGKYNDAISHFDTSLQYKYNSKYYAKALYWKGESYFQLNNHTKALQSYKAFEVFNTAVEESSQLNYQMAYCYFKLKEFDKSSVYFNKYLQNPDAEYKADAQLRLADSYYGNQEIDKAIATYDDIAENGEYEQDFAAFQKAVLIGIQGNDTEKITALESFIKTYPTSDYIEEAHYELGIAYQNDENYLRSISAFDKVIATKQSLKLFALAYIGKANNYAALNEDKKALNIYKDIAREFKDTDYASQAVLASKAVYIKQGNIKEYEAFALANGISISNEESEELYFLQAQKLYFEKDYNTAANSLTVFMQKYPNSARKSTIQYYLGDSYYRMHQDDKALTVLTPLAKKQTEYQEDALFTISKIHLDQQNDTEAKLALEALYQITQNQKYKNTIELELMYIYSEEENSNQAAIMAEKVLQNPKNPETVFEQAHLILARNQFIKKEYIEAKKLFGKLETAKNTAVKAEALYYKAYFKNKEKKYADSNAIVFKMTSDISDQAYWTTKALLVMADNYYKLKDTYQATYITDEIIKEYTEFPDLVQEAKELKKTFK